jgi:CRP-like cAMP-binding protein
MSTNAVQLAAVQSEPSTPVRPSLFLCASEGQAAGGVDLFAGLSEEEHAHALQMGLRRALRGGEALFRQGEAHRGIFVILSGAVRVFYTAPSGREITLAYWSPGNFVGGPELFETGVNMWSGSAVRPSEVLVLRGDRVRQLMASSRRFTVNLVEALVEKGKCYSALIHMLGTRSVTERLAELLLTIASFDGRPTPGGLLLGRTLTQEELARMVGATRQWVSTMLERFRTQKLIDVRRRRIVICDPAGLRQVASETTDRPAIR